VKDIPFKVGDIHFIGIGGIGMSGIAEVMHNLGYTVHGSDSAESANVKRLQGLGIPVMVGQRPENLRHSQVVVYSSAIKPDNPEFAEARARHLPLVRRAEMLAELMRLKWSIAVGGTHGKTTSTSMIAAILDAAGLDPTVINGGIINAYGTNARLGAGKWMVVESDESDGSFLRLPATIAVVTNIDAEHMEHYGSFEKLRSAFQTFVENVPFYGFAVLCIDHPEVQAMVSRVVDRRIVTYGLNPQADVRAVDISFRDGHSCYTVIATDRQSGEQKTLADMRLPMPGSHNVQNALAAIAVARELGIGDEVVRKALATFGGVKRRFTRTGTWNGVTVIDDYGHHPVEIAAVLAAARQTASGRIIAVVQPHRYTRLRDLFVDFCTCFNDAETVIVAPVYPAGEAPIEGINRDALVEGLRAHGHRHVLAVDDGDDVAPLVAELAAPGDYVVCLGAGSITHWANALPQALAAINAGGRR
jgi:UDP-N-acetylmuramate--alanine ligase